MNHNEEVPDNLGGLGDMLPAEVLKKVNELLEQLHRKDKDHQGSPVFIYAPGSQYVDKQFNIGAYHHPHASPQPSPKGKGDESAEALKKLPDVLATDKAITYAYTRWDNMMRYLEDGRLLLDNNLAENEIRPITLGRKNYLFCGNHDAAQNMAVVCSLLATCRNHDVNPRDYLNDVISQMPYHTKASYEELLQLLPHKWKLTHPESVMTKTA